MHLSERSKPPVFRAFARWFLPTAFAFGAPAVVTNALEQDRRGRAGERGGRAFRCDAFASYAYE